MASPKPGTKVRNSKTGRPTMVVLDLLGRRWALRILWELDLNGPSSFRTLQELCGGISPTVLNSRLSELREAGILEIREGGGYFITKEGVRLGRILVQLDEWAKDWAQRTAPGGASDPKEDFPGNASRKNKKA